MEGTRTTLKGWHESFSRQSDKINACTEKIGSLQAGLGSTMSAMDDFSEREQQTYSYMDGLAKAWNECRQTVASQEEDIAYLVAKEKKREKRESSWFGLF